MNAYIKKPFGSAQGRPFSSGLGRQHVTWQKITLGVGILILVLIFLNTFLAPVKNTVYALISPFDRFFWQLGETTHNFFGSFLNTKGLAQENTNLKQENQRLLSQVLSLQETVKEDKALKLVLENTKQDNFSLVATQVIGLDSSFDVMLIDRGSSNGIVENMPVISSTKVLYGKVLKVYKNFSQVVLVSNKQSVVDAKIVATDPASPAILGVMKGNGNLTMYLDLISMSVRLHQGDLVATSGLEGIFPKDLLIGKIASISTNDLKPFQTATIAPFLDFNSQDAVFVITNYK